MSTERLVATFDRWMGWLIGSDTDTGRIPEHPAHWDRESFIPMHPVALTEALATLGNQYGHDECVFRNRCEVIANEVHLRYRKRHERLIYLYAQIDPDRELNRNQPTDPEPLIRQVFEQFEQLLENANYRRLKPHQILEAIRTASHWGVRLRVRLGMFRRLYVYQRGDIVSRRVRRVWYKCFVREEIDLPIYQRLVVLFHIKPDMRISDALDPASLHARMFKNVPQADVDMLFPGTGIQISWLDTGKIGIPTAWGFAMLVSKLVKNIWLVALLGALKIVTSIAFALAIVIASIVYAIKYAFSYRTARSRYLLNVTRSLYYQTLANNTGVLLRLIEEAEQQETCEAILAYCVLSISPGGAPMQSIEIDRRCEQILEDFGCPAVDFDVDDALRDLMHFGIAEQTDAGWQLVGTKCWS